MNRKKITQSLLLFSITALMSCSQTPTAQEIVDQAVKAAGVDKLNNAEASFAFRDKEYAYKKTGGNYTYIRTQSDSAGTVTRDILTNDGLTRYIADTIATITEERQKAYANSVNSVIYFAFLPLWLNDEAVNKTYEGSTTIKDKNYHKIRVTFDQEGGGKDFEDVFFYWFDTEDYSMDYLAYTYLTDGGGVRFREAYNARDINGVTVQDYRNLKPSTKDNITFEKLEGEYKNGQLKQLSTIDLKDMKIKGVQK